MWVMNLLSSLSQFEPKRTYDASLVNGAITSILKTEDIFDTVRWVSIKQNVALINSYEDIALFEHEAQGVVSGHYSFKSRGRQAVIAGKAFLDEIFNPCYNIEIIRGLTPITNLGARWMSRQLGFTSHGVMKALNGPHEIFTLHRKEHIK